MPIYDKSKRASRIDWVDHAKGLGIILVVVGHVIRGLMGSSGNYNILALKFADEWIYSFHMPLFFFLSGLFASRTLNQPPRLFFSNKFRTILYPYIVWSAILGVLRTVSGQGSKGLAVFAVNFWKIIYQPTDIFWFLYTLFLIASVFYLLFRVKVPTLILLAASLALAVVSNLLPDLFSWSSLNRVFLYSAYFFTAATVSQFLLSLNGLHRKTTDLIIVILSSIGITLSTATGILKTPSPNLLIAFMGISGVISLSFLCTQCPKVQWIKTFGTYSLQIYVAHTIVGAFVRIVLFKVFRIEHFWVHFILETLTGLYVPILLALISAKLFPYLFFLPKKRTESHPT